MDKIYNHLLKPTKEKSCGPLFFFLSRIGSQLYVIFSILFQLSNGLTFPLTCTEPEDARLAKNFVTMDCSNKPLMTMDGKSQEIKYHRYVVFKHFCYDSTFIGMCLVCYHAFVIVSRNQSQSALDCSPHFSPPFTTFDYIKLECSPQLKVANQLLSPGLQQRKYSI